MKKDIKTYEELAEDIKEIIGQNCKMVAVNHVAYFTHRISVNRKGEVTLTLKFPAIDCLVDEGDIRFWKGQLLLVWIEFKDKDKFKYY